jgi:hypothetical protein
MDAKAPPPFQSGFSAAAEKEEVAPWRYRPSFAGGNAMKTLAHYLALVISTGSVLMATDLQPGASLEEVRVALGMPSGQLLLGGRQVLYFERGEVELQKGMVTRVNLRSPEEHAILRARDERLRVEREASRGQMRAEGTVLRERKLADPAFQAAPLAYQVAFWEDFSRRYPEVSCTEPLMLARLRLSEQLEENRRREELVERQADREERITGEEWTGIFPLYTSAHRFRWHHHHQAFGREPVSYTLFDKPLPPYTTPSGNPAGNLFAPSAGNPVVQNGIDREYARHDHENHAGRSHGRGPAGGGGRFRERL